MSSSSLPTPDFNLSSLAADKPFDASAKADIILRSIDSVDFFVLKAILSLASPVFDNMFSGAGESAKTKNGLPIVDLAEDSDTLYNLLLLVYPYAQEPTSTLDMCMKVGIAAQKYAMDEALQRLCKLVRRCEAIGREPLGAFALAVHFGWVDVIKEAAWNTLAVPLCDFRGGDELRMATGADIVDLLQWRFACGQAINLINGRPVSAKLVSLKKSKVPRPSMPLRRGMLEMIEQMTPLLLGGLDSITRSNPHSSSPAWGCQNETMSEYREVLENAKSLGKEIDEKTAKVPFRIRDTWVVAQIGLPTPILESPQHVYDELEALVLGT